MSLAPHRYWRLWITSSPAGSFLAVAEVELRSTPGGADQTGSGTALADNADNGAAVNAVDNSAATYWQTGSSGYPHWWKYDFGGSPKAVQQVVITPRSDQPSRGPGAFRLEWSDDHRFWNVEASWSGVTWPTAAAQTFNWATPPAIDAINPSPLKSTGGDTVILTGSGFVSGCTVTHGATSGIATTFISPTEVRYTSPAEAIGEALIRVTNPDASTGTRTAFVQLCSTAPHRHWRLWVTATKTNNYLVVAEIELRNALGGSDQTGSGTAAADNEAFGAASLAVDNNPATYWETTSGGYPHWWAYDFGIPVAVGELAMSAASLLNDRAPMDFKLQWSDDAASWTDELLRTGVLWAPSETTAFPVQQTGTFVTLRRPQMLIVT